MDVSELELQRIRNREIELKRLRGEVSCAECRRLKLRCDREVPCYSCVRRGLRDICPTGTVFASNMHQLPTCSTVNLSAREIDTSRKLAEMSDRIRALEDALQIASDATHPLLSPELLSIKRTTIDGGTGASVGELSTISIEDGLEDAFGTLTIGEGKAMQFLGASASEDVLLMDVFRSSEGSSSLDSSGLPAEISQLSEMWPFVPINLSPRSKLFQLGTHLPPFERVAQLVKTYFSYPVWFVELSQVQNELIPLFYPEDHPISPALLETENMHDLALLFMVLGGGAVAEDSRSLTNPGAERYLHLARTALSLNNILEHGSLSACQVLILLGSYEIQSGRKAAPETSWKLTCMGLNHATSIGLHRDPTHWRLDPDTAERRRWISWELFAMDKWKCMGSGRPPLFPLHAMDCEFPQDHEVTLDDGSKVESVRQWKYRFARDVLTRLADHFCSARPHKYSDIMDLDRLVRDFAVHPFVSQLSDPSFARFLMNQPTLHPLSTVWWKERALLYVHRSYFARAILEHGNNPMQSPFSSSFLAAYRSANTLLKTVQFAMTHKRRLKRSTPFWAMALSSSLIIGSVASRSSVAFASSALNELEQAILIFRDSDHPVAVHGLNILLKLRDKATASVNSQPVHRKTQPVSPMENITGSMVPDNPNPSSEDDEEELHVMRGTTRRIERPHSTPVAHQRSLPAAPLNMFGDRHGLSNGLSIGGGVTSFPTTQEQFGQWEPSGYMEGPLLPNQQQQGTAMPSFQPQSMNEDFVFLGSNSQTSSLDLAFEDVLAAQYYSTPSPDPLHSHSTNSDVPSDTFVSPSAFQSMSNFDTPNSGFEEGEAAFGELWHSFMQQFSPIEGVDPVLENWDAMEFA